MSSDPQSASYDVLIVGQGLAGAALAMALMKRGKRLAVVDDGSATAASRVAAGLVTTLAGKGMNPAWRQAEYWPRSLAYYRALEEASGQTLFHAQPVLRLFGDDKEAAKFARKKAQVADWVGSDAPQIDLAQVHGGFGGFEMAQGGRLDTQVYLAVVREQLMKAGVDCVDTAFDSAELQSTDAGLRWRDLEAKQVILCQGARGLRSGPFSDMEHRCAKGEMLTVRVPELEQQRIINRNGWMVPIGDGLWRAGATYGWDDLEPNPTESGRAGVLKKVAELTPLAFDIVSHDAGVRPIIRKSQPVIAFSEDYPGLSCFNGLGSKGVITAPCVAEQFAAFLCGEIDALDPDLLLS
ncbi:NAD(P)/FAD-dependent oxidoreductase [Rubritalea marina]|uniref:NAD(P)/FAD-dependent oxidoreductase n=1 Tax=Rubritalea marina TaxID=361055 RepID=UPI00039CB158|nr:FAD-dependent oxidoreductase [Rubritalea marina]